MISISQMADIVREILPGTDFEKVEALCRAGQRAGDSAADFRARVHRAAAQQRADLEKHGGSALCSEYDRQWRSNIGGWR